jgi:beta-glucanase (GH16 family)
MRFFRVFPAAYRLPSLVALLAFVPVFGVVVAAHAQAAPGEHLVWSDEFSGPSAVPNPANWTYDVGGGGWYNKELETYCAPTTDKPPCLPSQPNAFVAADGFLHITARRNAAGEWTSARMVSKGLQSFQYGRIEARIKIPAGPGVWPAFWMMGDDSSTNYWPGCGELDIMENIGGEPSTIHGSIHGPGMTGMSLGKSYQLPSGANFAAGFHTFGMIWSPGRVQYYVDDPAHPYASFTPGDIPAGAKWPFDQGKFYFLLNFAVGGGWPGNPTAATASPNEMLVDYVRVYQTTPKP